MARHLKKHSTFALNLPFYIFYFVLNDGLRMNNLHYPNATKSSETALNTKSIT